MFSGMGIANLTRRQVGSSGGGISIVQGNTCLSRYPVGSSKDTNHHTPTTYLHSSRGVIETMTETRHTFLDAATHTYLCFRFPPLTPPPAQPARSSFLQTSRGDEMRGSMEVLG